MFSTYEPYARYGSNYYGLRGRLVVTGEDRAGSKVMDPIARRRRHRQHGHRRGDRMLADRVAEEVGVRIGELLVGQLDEAAPRG